MLTRRMKTDHVGQQGCYRHLSGSEYEDAAKVYFQRTPSLVGVEAVGYVVTIALQPSCPWSSRVGIRARHLLVPHLNLCCSTFSTSEYNPSKNSDADSNGNSDSDINPQLVGWRCSGWSENILVHPSVRP
jgi:hypothetical protein